MPSTQTASTENKLCINRRRPLVTGGHTPETEKRDPGPTTHRYLSVSCTPRHAAGRGSPSITPQTDRSSRTRDADRPTPRDKTNTKDRCFPPPASYSFSFPTSFYTRPRLDTKLISLQRVPPVGLEACCGRRRCGTLLRCLRPPLRPPRHFPLRLRFLVVSFSPARVFSCVLLNMLTSDAPCSLARVVVARKVIPRFKASTISQRKNRSWAKNVAEKEPPPTASGGISSPLCSASAPDPARRAGGA